VSYNHIIRKTAIKSVKDRQMRIRRGLWLALLFLITLGAICIALPFWLAGPNKTLTPEPFKIPFPESNASTTKTLNLITLNIVHGRGGHPLNPFLSREKAKLNLQAISNSLKRENLDLIALQEADTMSFWSGSFDHVQYLADKLEWTQFVRGQQVHGLNLQYGTALLSRFQLMKCSTKTFSSSLFSLPKGYVKATFGWPNEPTLKIDIISLHLDFMRAAVRERQVDELAQLLKDSSNPLIIMGDFNCEWNSADSAVKRLATLLRLKAYKPAGENMETFPNTKKRLDWILLSPSLQFESYEIIPDILSDHLAIKASISRTDLKRN